MTIRFTCPLGHPLKVPDEKAGRGMLCPVCQERVTVPEADVADSKESRPQPPPIENSRTKAVDAEIDEHRAPMAGVSLPVPLPTRNTGELTPQTLTRTRPRDSAPWGVAAGLLIVLAYSTLPALGHVNDAPMPVWVRVVIGMALLQAVFVVWMLIVRHWGAMVVVTLSFAVASTSYAIFIWFAANMVIDDLDSREMASRAGIWSATVLAVYLVATYLCGSAAANWRRKAAERSGG